MSPAELTDYLHRHIPLSGAMQVEAVAVGVESVTLRAPLAPNINHQATLFGGSASTLCILAAWSLLHVRLTAAGLASQLVIQRNTMDYLLPVDGDALACAVLAEPAQWDSFLRLLARRGRARITVQAELQYAAQVAGRLRGDFVALGGGHG